MVFWQKIVNSGNTQTLQINFIVILYFQTQSQRDRMSDKQFLLENICHQIVLTEIKQYKITFMKPSNFSE